MDGRRLDRIARALGAETDRRGALRVLAAALLAGGALRRSHLLTRAQESPPPMACSSDADCAAGPDPCTGAICLEGVCQHFIAHCAPGYVCCGNGSCCPGDAPVECFVDADCEPETYDPCLVVSCDAGMCLQAVVDCAPGTGCCGGGVCCPVEVGGCVSDADCATALPGMCEQAKCLDGVCVLGSTACPPGSRCVDDICIPLGIALS